MQAVLARSARPPHVVRSTAVVFVKPAGLVQSTGFCTAHFVSRQEVHGLRPWNLRALHEVLFA
jgi:hypothetical protein